MSRYEEFIVFEDFMVLLKSIFLSVLIYFVFLKFQFVCFIRSCMFFGVSTLYVQESVLSLAT